MMKKQAREFSTILEKKLQELKQCVLDNGGPTKTVYDCPKCRDIGAVVVIDKEGNEALDFCDCYYAKKDAKAKELNGIAELFRTKTLKNFRSDSKEQKLAKKQARKYLDNYSSESMVLCGHVGSGKTHIAVAVAVELETKNFRVMFLDYAEMIQKLEELKGYGQTEYLSRIKNAKLLVIDDLLKTGYTEWNGAYKLKPFHKEIVYKIVNHRYNNRKPMIVTTELNLEKMLQIDEAISSRLISMAGDNIVEFNGDNDNYRLFGEREE
jgi:DNA replication protein DnaC